MSGKPPITASARIGATPLESKGIVEHLCGYAQSDLVVPLLTEARLALPPHYSGRMRQRSGIFRHLTANRQ